MRAMHFLCQYLGRTLLHGYRISIKQRRAPRLFTHELLTRVYYHPPPPRSFGIKELGSNSSKIFDFKGLIGKIFRNKDLAIQIALKMTLGQLRTTRSCPNSITSMALGGLDVNDFDRRWFVMRNQLSVCAGPRLAPKGRARTWGTVLNGVSPWTRTATGCRGRDDRRLRSDCALRGCGRSG